MTRTEPNFTPDKPREYRIYLIWKTLPKNYNTETWTELGITDELIHELTAIKTQKQFAEHYKLHPGTLTDWNKQLVPPEYKQYDWRYWARQATPKIAQAVMRESIRSGDASRFTAWMKYVEEVEEKSSVRIDTSDELLDTLKAIAERHGDS